MDLDCMDCSQEDDLTEHPSLRMTAQQLCDCYGFDREDAEMLCAPPPSAKERAALRAAQHRSSLQPSYPKKAAGGNANPKHTHKRVKKVRFAEDVIRSPRPAAAPPQVLFASCGGVCTDAFKALRKKVFACTTVQAKIDFCVSMSLNDNEMDYLFARD
jgi:hypothetical protein